MPIITDTQALRDMLGDARTIAALGASNKKGRPANYVPEFMATQGFAVYPVNPGYPGQPLWGQVVVAELGEVPEAVDLVYVLRGPGKQDGVAAAILALEPRPRAVWFQLGCWDDATATDLDAAGLDLVKDLDLMGTYQKLKKGTS